MKNLKKPSNLLIAIIIFSTGFLIGKSTTPTKIVEKIKIKKVTEIKEKIIKVEVLKKNRSERVSEVITVKKDGTKIIKREIIKINKDENTNQTYKISNKKEKIETKKYKKTTFNKINLSIYTNFKSIKSVINPEYGVLIQKKIILDFNIGVGYTNKKRLMLSIGYNF